jgi:hypothetical protein
MHQIEKALRLLAALDLEDLSSTCPQQVRRRLNPVYPARRFQIRVSHDTVLDMRVRKQLRSRPAGLCVPRPLTLLKSRKHAENSMAKAKKANIKNETKTKKRRPRPGR